MMNGATMEAALQGDIRRAVRDLKKSLRRVRKLRDKTNSGSNEWLELHGVHFYLERALATLDWQPSDEIGLNYEE